MFLSVFWSLIVFTESCTKIIIETSNENFDWIAGTFVIDPTLVADGRPVYTEILSNPDLTKRSLYHYSHEIADTDTEYEQKDFSGRWILGNSMYSSNGWIYIESWSISPAQNMMSTLVNTANNITELNNNIHPKMQWRIFADEQWQFDRTGQITFKCDTMYDDITRDWLFITTPNQHQFNILNPSLSTDDNELSSITGTNLHGFYYRISEQYWRKIESKIYLRNSMQNDIEFEYSFLYYDNYTHPDGTPNMELHAGYTLVTNDLAQEWIVVDGQHRQYQAETVAVALIMITEENDDIYSAFRRYWTELKMKSFAAVTTHLKDADRDKMVVSLNNGLPFMMLGLGTGGLDALDAAQSMEWAINNIGYRLVDGAQAYHNENALGRMAMSIHRDDLFITSKVWPTDLGFIQTSKVILASLNKLKTNYLDLYMIHWNSCNPDVVWMHCEQASNRPWGQTYQIMEKLYGEGYLLNLGISNYNFNTFNEILNGHNMQIIPQIIQNYFDISHADWEFAEFVSRFGIIYQGYAQYRGIAEAQQRFENGQIHYTKFKEKLNEISVASTNGKASESQVLLRWLIEMGIAVIPRSSNFKHLEQNWNIWDFELPQKDLKLLTQMSIDQNLAQQKAEL